MHNESLKCELSKSSSHCIICPTHGPLVDLKRHSHNVAHFFIYESPYDENSITSWFQIASGITEVKYISDLFDDMAQWCGPAIDYENAKSDFHSKLVKELTRFNFIWGGFEAFLDSFELPTCPNRRGKINDVNYFLRKVYENKYPLIQYYAEVVEFLKKLLSRSPWYGDVENLFAEAKCVSKRINGLKVVYKIRNAFAHGSFHFSEPADWNPIKPHDIKIIAASSRIVLFTIQMLLISTRDDLNFNVARLHEPPDENCIEAQTYLLNMHLKNFKYS